MITLQHISKSFGRQAVLKQVSYEFERGSVFSLIGPNASGKTTLIKCILGLVKPDEGLITVDGMNITASCSYRSKIGYMPQISSFPETMTVKQVMDMIIQIRKSDARVNRGLLEAYDLKAIYSKRMHTLSGGTRQKVNAAIAMLFDVEALMLDEPTAGLDPLSASILKERILEQRRAGKLVLITTHNMADIDELSDRVIYLENGRIRFIKPVQELKSLSGNQSVALGIQQLIRQHEYAH